MEEKGKPKVNRSEKNADTKKKIRRRRKIRQYEKDE